MLLAGTDSDAGDYSVPGMISGNDLLERCVIAVRTMDGETERPAEAMAAGYCFGYIDGTIESPSMRNTDMVKLPKGGTRGQLVRVVTKYLQSNPKKLTLPAEVLVFFAFSDAFPGPGKH
jgi:hypothetical protein